MEAAVFDMYGISGKRQLQEFFHGSADIVAFLPVKKHSAFTALTGQLKKQVLNLLELWRAEDPR